MGLRNNISRGSRAPSEEEIRRWFDGKEFSVDWTSHHLAVWLPIFLPLRDRVRDVLEIGSWEGRSSVFFLEFFPDCNLTCIDTFAGGPTCLPLPEGRVQVEHCEHRFDANLAPYAERVRKIKGRSARELDRLGERGEKFDLIYIDGEHLRDDVLIDSVMAWHLLRPDGILVWDDYAWGLDLPADRRPQQAIDAALSLYAGEYVELHRDYQVIIRRAKT